MEKYKDIGLLKCIKCETDEDLIPYFHREKYEKFNWGPSGKVSTTSIYSIHVPVCQNCAREFEEWTRARPMDPQDLWCYGCLGLIVGGVLYYLFGLLAIPFYIALGIFCLYVLKRYWDYDQLLTNPSNYITINGRDTFHVKSASMQEWIRYENWEQEVLKSRLQDHYGESLRIPTYCSKCGSKIDLSLNFCNKCGADIKIIPQDSF